MSTVTVIILAKNEEQNIKDCIDTVGFADEVLVIDDFSTDQTPEIAASMGARVVQHAMNGDWGGQQTFAIQEAKSKWILFLDADERISPELGAEIVTAVQKDEPKA
ncbi:MAG: glycosyltransferase family 2 protein, partial [Veillonella caviae]